MELIKKIKYIVRTDSGVNYNIDDPSDDLSPSEEIVVNNVDDLFEIAQDPYTFEFKAYKISDVTKQIQETCAE